MHRHLDSRSPQIWTPFLSTCVIKRAQRTRDPRCSLSSFADLARVKSSKQGSRSGGFYNEHSTGLAGVALPWWIWSFRIEEKWLYPSEIGRVRNSCPSNITLNFEGGGAEFQGENYGGGGRISNAPDFTRTEPRRPEVDSPGSNTNPWTEGAEIISQPDSGKVGSCRCANGIRSLAG